MKIINVDGFDVQVSDEDWLWLVGFKWYISRWGYAQCTKKSIDGERDMHNIIAKAMGLDVSKWIDHKDTNKLNNQRGNLRVATKSQNQANRGAGANNKLGVKGVSELLNGKYHAVITVNYKTIHLGDFDTIDEASDAYTAAAIKYFGEYAQASQFYNA